MRKNTIILFIIIITVSLVFGGCTKTISETEQHSYFSKGGKFYIHYEKDYTKDPQLYYVESPVYDSYDEIIAVLTQNIATDETREYLQRRFGDKNGDICVFDVNNMYRATHPDFDFFKIAFNNRTQSSYDVILKNRQVSITQALRVTVFGSEENYQQLFEKDIVYSEHSKTEVSELERENAKAYYYDSYVRDSIDLAGSNMGVISSFVKYKEIHYTLSPEDGREVYVIELYKNPTEEAAELPKSVTAYVKDNGTYYRIFTEWVYNEPPTEEWLLSFGIEPYVPAGE